LKSAILIREHNDLILYGEAGTRQLREVCAI